MNSLLKTSTNAIKVRKLRNASTILGLFSGSQINRNKALRLSENVLFETQSLFSDKTLQSHLTIDFESLFSISRITFKTSVV